MDNVKMFVNGQAMRGGSLHAALTDATFLSVKFTTPRYRFYSFRDEFPGLREVDSGGVAVEGELYEVSYATLRDVLWPREPPELEATVVELSDGSGALCMKVRPEAFEQEGVRDISQYGSWRTYLQS